MAKASEVIDEAEVTIQPAGTRPRTVLEEFDRLKQNDSLEPDLTLEERRHRAFERLKALKGKIHLDIDIDELRGRNR